MSHGPQAGVNPNETDKNSHNELQQNLDTDSSAPVSFGKQNRRRGLQANLRSSAPQERSAFSWPAAPNISASRQPPAADSSQASVKNAQQLPAALPPHLKAGMNPAQSQQTRIFIPRSPPADQESSPGARDRSSADDSRKYDQRASSNAADVAEIGDRAEGVLQMGASGARIPLYGRCLKSSPLCCVPISLTTNTAHATAVSTAEQGCYEYGHNSAGFIFLLSGLGKGCSEVMKTDILLHRSVESILQAVKLDRRRLEGIDEVAPDDDEDLLEVTFDQLPSGYNKREFDWSGQTNYAQIHRQVT